MVSMMMLMLPNRKGDWVEPSGQLIGKPVAHVPGGQVVHVPGGQVVHVPGGQVAYIRGGQTLHSAHVRGGPAVG